MLTEKQIHAREVLEACKVPLDSDYDILTWEQVDVLLVHAKRYHYRKPANANGSLGRYFHAKMQREASDRPVKPQPAPGAEVSA